MISTAVLPQLQRALGLHQTGRSAEAWTILAPLRQAVDGQGQALRVFALVAQAAGRVDDAIWALERIAALEGAPAEILGAIADTCGKAGRHAEAYERWSAMVARYPDIAEAHLNRAIAAADAGKQEESILAADAGLERFPGHARLLATRAMALKNAGRIHDSVAAFELAVAADPGRALTRQNQGVALRSACRYEEACEAFAEAERLGITGPRFLANWAAAALEANCVDQAEQLYRRALADDPAHNESLNGLNRLLIEYRDGEDAFSQYAELVAQRPSPDSWVKWLSALASNKNWEAMAETGRRGLSNFPSHARIRSLTAFAEGISGDAGDAAQALQTIAGLPADELRSPMTIFARAELALRAGQPELAAQLAEEFVSMDHRSQMGWSLLSIAWRVLDDPRENWLCDYDRLVMVTEVPSPDGSLHPREFASRVAAVLDPLHQTKAAPGNQSLRHGTQTSGTLFGRPHPVIQELREAVINAARGALAGLPREAHHPFLGRRIGKLGFSGSWSVRLKGGGGHHVPHFHNLGWMSSAYYARLPVSDNEARERHEGWIQFGSPPAMFGLDLPPRRIVEPAPGMLVLFPSYMWHGTIPFASGDRLTAAFDYQPE